MTARPAKPVIVPIVLTPEQEAIRAGRDEIDRQVENLREQINDLKATRPKCKPHVFDVGEVRKSDWFWSDWHKTWSLSTSVCCVTCGKYGGWYCPVNPARRCEYDFDEDPLGDSCIHCGAPDERK